ncbi:Na+/H+ antiporter [Acetobacteraceae bacterium KSS8]|uniref:Na+/H+ antiporter n=1 Tax=Endosaccharibacter trunci TaxID=2812733 RepID=A0ABT1W3M8_9PROT|nr:Na+/H+ antiporter [Acetobacteraceae bacterium KSS8]
MLAASHILLLLFVTTLCGPLARLVRLPMPLLQIAMGAAACLLGMRTRIEPDVFMLLFIPPLLFSDAFLMPMRELRQMRGLILGLAVGLVLFATICGGLFIHLLIPPLNLAACFALAAVLSPTDAVAVSGMLEGRAVPRRLMHVLAGEALLNDASGLVCFRFAAAAAVSGSFSLLNATGTFLLVSLGGLAVGIAGAVILALVQRALMRGGFDHAPTFFGATALLPFTVYLAAEHLGGSGILAAVAAGLTLRRSGTFKMMGTQTRLGSSAIWTTLVFLLNGMVFVVLGLQLPGILDDGLAMMRRVQVPLWRLPAAVLEITVALIVLRLVWLAGTVLVRSVRLRLVPEPGEERRVTPRLLLATAFAGVRGAITLAAVLSLDDDFPARNLLVTLATGVILCSLLLAAIALPLLLAGVATDAIDPHEQEIDHARLALADKAVAMLEEEIEDADEERHDVLRTILDEARAKRERLKLAAEDAPEEERDHQLATFRRQRQETAIRLRLLRAERQSLSELNHRGEIDDDTERALMHELDHQEEVVLATARSLPRALPRDHEDHPEYEAFGNAGRS